MRIFDENNIAGLSFIYAIVIVGVMTFATGGLLIGQKFQAMNRELFDLEEAFVVEQKQKLKSDVNLQLAKIDYQREYHHQLLEQRLQNRVMETTSMARRIYETMHVNRSDEEIARIIKEAVRPMRFYDKQGYFFILNTEGEAVLYPVDASLEGTNFVAGREALAPETIKDIVKISRQQGAGFHRYKWTKPDGAPGRLYDKVSFVARFEPLDWIIGTGEYYDNLDAMARGEITRELEKSFNRDTDDYFFIYQLHNMDGGEDFATMLINSNRSDLIGRKLSDDYVDAKGKEFRKEFMAGIRQNGEAHVVYWYKKPDGSGVGRKMSYFKYYPQWQWIVARGIYFDRLDQLVAEKQAGIRDKMRSDILLLCIIFVVAVTCALGVASVYASNLQAVFDRFRTTQKEHLEKLEDLNETLKIQSRTDALTQLFNRGHFNQQLNRETSRARRYNTPLSIILFDIDYFKEINDTFGHLAGDEVLKELAELIGSNIRLSDLLARWGGEEFAILAPGVDCRETEHFAEKLRHLVAQHTFSVERQITCSFGVSCYVHREDSESFVQRVDEALYRAKQAGRNRCVSV